MSSKKSKIEALILNFSSLTNFACSFDTLWTNTSRSWLRYLSSHGLVLSVLACALFLRGVGLSAVGIPSISAAYASVRKQNLPMATTSLNIVQRLGGPALTTLCAPFLGWRVVAAHSSAGLIDAFTAGFVLLCGLHA